MKKYFVMLFDPDGNLVPMKDLEGGLYTYDALDEAIKDARNTLYGNAYGGKVFFVNNECAGFGG